MLTPTHSAGSVVSKATIATARGATMHITVCGLFHTIYEERTEGDERNARSDSMQRSKSNLYPICVD